MEDEWNSFYVVRKGDITGIFKNLSDCQIQTSSIVDPAVSVYKGCALSKEAEQHFISHGLRNPSYVISAAHTREDLFGTLVPCVFQEPLGSTSGCMDPSKKPKITRCFAEFSCVLEFDGASKGNPGKAGAGAILRCKGQSAVWRLREGLGVATNNVAEYRALILGLRCALEKGFKKIQAQGDSQLVCMQIQDRWLTKNKNMIELCKVAKELRDKFESFSIIHVDRCFNSEADYEANLAILLENGAVEEDFNDKVTADSKIVI